MTPAKAVRDAQRDVENCQAELDRAMDRRRLTFALANKHGMSSADIGRAVKVAPHVAHNQVREGHRDLARRRAA